MKPCPETLARTALPSWSCMRAIASVANVNSCSVAAAPARKSAKRRISGGPHNFKGVSKTSTGASQCDRRRLAPSTESFRDDISSQYWIISFSSTSPPSPPPIPPLLSHKDILVIWRKANARIQRPYFLYSYSFYGDSYSSRLGSFRLKWGGRSRLRLLTSASAAHFRILSKLIANKTKCIARYFWPISSVWNLSLNRIRRVWNLQLPRFHQFTLSLSLSLSLSFFYFFWLSNDMWPIANIQINKLALRRNILREYEPRSSCENFQLDRPDTLRPGQQRVNRSSGQCCKS